MQECEWCGRLHPDVISPYCSQRCAHEARNSGVRSSRPYISTQELGATSSPLRPSSTKGYGLATLFGMGLASFVEWFETKKVNVAEVDSCSNFSRTTQNGNKTSRYWFVWRKNQKRGPANLEQLKELAESGKLRPDDFVCQGSQEWVRASRIPQLFPKTHVAKCESTHGDQSPSSKWHPALIAVVVSAVGLGGFVSLCCFCCTIGDFISIQYRKNVRNKLNAAHALWDEGNERNAVAAYRDVLKYDSHVIEEPERTKVFNRAVIFEIENNNTETAFELLETADEYDVVVASNTRSIQALIDQWRAEKSFRRHTLAEDQIP